MYFYFYSSLLKLKLIFLPSPKWRKSKLSNWNQGALAGHMSLSPGSVPPPSSRQVLERSRS